MAYKTHHEIVEAAKSKRSDFTAMAIKYAEDVDALWEHLDSPHSMLDMFEESNYALQHFDAFVEFGRWLRSEEQKRDYNVGSFDEALSYKKAKIKEEIEKINAYGHSAEEELNKRLWDTVLYSSRRLIDSLIGSAKMDLIWEPAISPRTQENIDAPNLPMQVSARISQKLRELIPAPFLPVV